MIADALRAERGIRGDESDAFEYGDFNSQRQQSLARYCDAIALADSASTDLEYLQRSLASALATLVAETGLPCDAITINDVLRWRLVDAGMATVTELSDAEKVADWSQLIDQIPTDMTVVRARNWKWVGDYHQRRGEYEHAIAAYSNCLRDVDDDMHYLARGSAAQLAACQFALDQTDKAIAALERVADTPGQAILPECERRLVAGDTGGLLAELRRLEESVALEWLSNNNVQTRLAQLADWQSVIGEFPGISPSNLNGQSDATLIIRGAATEQRIRQAVNATFGTETALAAIELAHAVPGWLATSSSGDRVLFLAREVKFDNSALPPLLAAAFDEPVTAIDLYPIDDRPKAFERLFRLMHELADTESIAAQWSSYLWYGKGLKEQLVWRDRVPLNHRTLKRSLVELAAGDVDEEAEAALDSMEDWAEWIREADGRLKVKITTPTFICEETLSAEATDVIAQDSRISVTPLKDSLIHPLIRAEVPITVPYWRVRLIEAVATEQESESF